MRMPNPEEVWVAVDEVNSEAWDWPVVGVLDRAEAEPAYRLVRYVRAIETEKE